MSIRATNFVRRLRGLSPVEKAVAFVIGDHDDHKGGGAYPSMATVADEAGLKNRETASRATTRLVEKKVLIPQEEDGKPTLYRFNYTLQTCDSPVTPTRDSPVIPPVTQPVTLDSRPVTRGVTPGHKTCDSPVTQRVEGFKGNTNSREAEEGIASLASAATATIRDAFLELGCEEPFGDPQFQLIWAEEWNKLPPGANGGGVDAMERTAQRCQLQSIPVPPFFYRVKRKVEEAEVQHRFRKTTL
jgi:hypothetical protein